MSSYQAAEILPSLALEIPPLTFDRLYKGYVTKSTFPLLHLPIELFLHILRYFTIEELKTLSLVDRFCMRLAMPSIHKDITLCYPPNKRHLLLGNIPVSYIGMVNPIDPPFGVNLCVRRLAITCDPSCKVSPNHSTTITRSNILAPEKDIPIQCLVQSLCDVVERLLPNLHILDWDLPVTMCATTLRSLLASSAKHLRIEGAVLDEEGCAFYDRRRLHLETLSLNVSPTLPALLQRSTHRFFDRVLRGTRRTLRQLRWTGCLEFEDIYISNVAEQFPSLRSLTLDTIARNSDNVIQLLLGPLTRVETLAMDTMTPSALNFFGTRGYMAPLKHFCFLIHDQGDSAPFAQIMEFLAHNNQLETLHIPGPVSPSILSQSLLPALTQHFKWLTSLHLVWASSDIQEEALGFLTSIRSLRHLWLSAGNQSGMRNTWKIDHEPILAQLSRLPHLLTLAFSRDTYAVDAHPLAPRSWDYYSSKALPVSLDISTYLSPPDFDTYQATQERVEQNALRRLAWGKWHAERMLMLGNRYGMALPSLTWLFVGQLVLLSNRSIGFEFASQRDPGLTVLQKKMSLTLWRPV